MRFLVEEEQKFSFCIPDDEPHILRIKLKRSGGRTIMNGRRGGVCEAVALEPGSYSLDVYQDGRSVGVDGKKAFPHRPQQAFLLGSSQNGFMVPDFMAFKGPEGKFVSGDTSDTPLLSVQAIATNVPAILSSALSYRIAFSSCPMVTSVTALTGGMSTPEMALSSLPMRAMCHQIYR